MQRDRAYNFGVAMLRLITVEQESIHKEDSGDERKIPARRIRYDLCIAKWLFSRGFSWEFFGIYGNWQYSFRTFRSIPKNALIVDFCKEGDLINAQRMFEKGPASPFDRVKYECEERLLDGGTYRYEEEWSLLHVGCANPKILQSSLTSSHASGFLSLTVIHNYVSS